MNYNKVMISGNLTRDPELKYITNGTAVATTDMAINETYKTGKGEKKDNVVFVKIVFWGKRAELVTQYCKKGSLLFVEGRLQYKTWEQDGKKRSSLEILADNIKFLNGKNGR